MFHLLLFLILVQPGSLTDSSCNLQTALSVEREPLWDGHRLLMQKGLYIYESQDGYTWTLLGPGLSRGMAHLAVANGIYLAADDYAVYLSQDAIHWTQVYTLGYVQGILWNGTQWFIWNSSASALSADGQNWTSVNLSVGSYGTVVWGAGRYLASGYPLRTSVDGLNWVETQNGYSNVEYLGGQFLAAEYSGVYRSANGLVWEFINLPANTDKIVFNGQVYLFVNAGRIFSSPDLTVWTETAAQGAEKVVWTGETFLTSPIIYSSPDGTSWELLNISGTVLTDGHGNGYVARDPYESTPGYLIRGNQAQAVLAVADFQYLNGVFFTHSSDDALYASADGLIWREVTSEAHSDVFFNGSRWFFFQTGLYLYSENGTDWYVDLVDGIDKEAKYVNGFYYRRKNGIQRSSDLEHWVAFSLPGRLDSLHWTGTAYLCEASSILYRSEDGIEWDTVQGTKAENKLVRAKFVQVGTRILFYGAYQLLTSGDDGRNWVASNLTGQVDSLGSNGTQFAASSNGALFLSEDGRSWTDQNLENLGTSFSFSFNAIVGDGQRWLLSNLGSVARFECGSVTPTAIDRPAIVFPWVVANETWQSRLAIHNSSDLAVEVRLVAEDRDGNRQSLTQLIPSQGLFTRPAEELFPGMNGYNVRVYCFSDEIQGTFLTFNENPSAGTHSPAQAEGVLIGALSKDLLFAYIPGEEVPAVTVSNLAPDASETVVTFTLRNTAGAILGEAQKTLTGGRPFAATVADLFPTINLPAEGSLRATGPEAAKLSGTTFVFNHLGQPSMDRAHIVYEP